MYGIKQQPSRYESGIWSEAEQKYDATKRKCQRVLKAIRKFWYYLYGVRFVLETNASVLVAQLNQSGTDLPGALVTRWLAYINLFDFDVKHVSGKTHTAADGLSRRPPTAQDLENARNKPDLEDVLDAELNYLGVNPTTLENEGEELPVLEEGFSEKSVQIATYLTTLHRPPHLSSKEFRKFKSEALRYKVVDQLLFRQNSKNIPLRRVIDNQEERTRIIAALHDESGHRGCKSTYCRIADRYWWDNLHAEVKVYVQTCEQCQLRDSTRAEEPMYPTYLVSLFSKVAVDAVHMPNCRGYRYLIIGRCDTSGWVEAQPVEKLTAKRVADFLWKDFICRHGCFGKLVIDGGAENKGVVKTLLDKYGIKQVLTSAYHPQANGMVERGHRPIIDALAKMGERRIGDWVKDLPAVLWADRSTIKVTTNITPYRIVCGQDLVLPIELEIPTWRILL